MRINTSTHYAIRVMLYLAEQKRIVPSAELAEHIAISQRYLMQISAKLRDGRLIGTTVGMSGGYALLKDPSLISAYDVVALMEGVADIPGSAADIPDGSKLYNALSLLRDYVETYLRSIRLDRLTDKNMAEWQEEFADIVETHIAALRQNV
ncbi:MAG: Rrf2 family transcriptional regulator [Peptococcaceae bacterium]|jgi:Rrf2 family protein|nr:Rrf2 family transcriptional regulator [Peptococcaceae bacterium]